MVKNIGLFFCILWLVGCASMQGTPREQHNARCQQLKTRILMNGATPNQRAAQSQERELSNLQETYDKEGC